MKAKKISILLVLAFATALLCTACGSSEDEQTTMLQNDTSTTEWLEPVNQNSSKAETSGIDTTAENLTLESENANKSISTSAGQSITPDATQTTEISSATTQTTKPTIKEKDIYKSTGTRKIWALVVGDVYMLFRSTTKGQIYELHVNAGDGYSIWSEGSWKLNDAKDTLTLTPTNQSENGNIGVAVGSSKTYKANKGVFTIDITFEQSGKTTIKLDLEKDAL